MNLVHRTKVKGGEMIESFEGMEETGWNTHKVKSK